MNEQERAIQCKTGPCVILAGAGTGKTYTIVQKISYLLKEKIYKPQEIVCITFSNEAARNLLERVRNQVSADNDVIIKTFHAFSAQLLRSHGSQIGISEKFRVLDPDSAKILLHRQLKVQPVKCHSYIQAIGTAKDLGISIEALEEYLSSKTIEPSEELLKKIEDLQLSILSIPKEEKTEALQNLKDLKKIYELNRFTKVWKAYEKLKTKNNYLDYSDLNSLALDLLKKKKSISEEYKYLIVDEFQDTNKVQLDLIFALAPHKNITVVGDLNQSIYRFRGAYKENFSLFKSHFNVSKESTFHLDKSYRSPNSVLKIAHDLILKNYENPEEAFQVKNAANIEGEKIRVFELENNREEARKVVEIIENEIAGGTAPEEICVIYRNHKYGLIIQKTLESKNIPFASASKTSLLHQKSIRTSIDYLQIINKISAKEKGGTQFWWDLLFQGNLPEKDLVILGKFIREQKDEENSSAKLLNRLESTSLTPEGKLRLKIILDNVKSLIPFASEKVPVLLEHIFALVVPSSEKTKDLILNLNKFRELAREYSEFYGEDLQSFLHHLDAIETLNISIPSVQTESKGIRLMTLHATKGLEFKTIILTNLAEKRFPSEKVSSDLLPPEIIPELKSNIPKNEDIKEFVRKYESHHQLLEERRLCYVAFTRAKEKLFLTYAKEYSSKKHAPSRFLQEINYLENPIISLTKDEQILWAEPETKIQLGSDMEEKSNIKKLQFSPSALLTFSRCQKEFEFRFIFNMPDRHLTSWEEIQLGSFVHLVLEKGVNLNYSTLTQFLLLAKELQENPEWEKIDFREVQFILKTFLQRHKGKFSEKSKTEIPLPFQLGGLRFIGIADRIDFLDNGIQIIDYKTGKSQIPAKSRNWQLGYYAIAASKLGRVKSIILDNLRHPEPQTFELHDNGDAISESGNVLFNIYEVKNEMIETAKKILKSQESGFQACSPDKNCPFCKEYSSFF